MTNFEYDVTNVLENVWRRMLKHDENVEIEIGDGGWEIPTIQRYNNSRILRARSL